MEKESKNNSVYEEIQMKAKQKGLTLSELCRIAEIPRVTISKWKDANPKSIDTINNLLDIIEKYNKNEND